MNAPNIIWFWGPFSSSSSFRVESLPSSELLSNDSLLEPARKALQTLYIHAERIVGRGTSTYTNACLEGMNGRFQAAIARARGYRTD